MKRGREEESGKSVSPLFPRLHINDACKGGPRAPPRNKMALYEQLSVPSQRSGLLVPFPPQHSGMTRLPLPSHGGEVCGYKKSPFPHYHMRSQLPAGSSGNVHSNSSNTISINSARVFGRKSSKHATRSNASGPSQSATECNSSRQIPSQKAHSRNVSENTDHFTVPAFMRFGIVSYLKKCQNITAGTHFKSAESRKIAAIGPSSQIPSSRRSALGRCRITKLSSENATKQDVAEPATSIKHIRDPLSEQGFVKEVAGTANTRSSSLDEDQCQDHHVQYIRVGSSADAGIVGKATTSRAELEPEKHNLHGTDPAEPIDVGNEAGCSGREVNKDNSETSILETDPCFNMSPDAVAGVIGAKHFWKARRAIVNQQRIFSVQVFELHRLIRVQKLIAALPHVLVEGNPCFECKDIPSMELPNDNTTRKSTRMLKEPKEKSKNENSSQFCPEAHARKAMPPPESCPARVCEDTENSSADQVASQNQPSPWCFPPPGNQWLVPVMSPSEGLVYKPYTGPCPPPTGFMPSVYGGHTPLPQLTPSYAIPTPQQHHSNIHYGTSVPSHYSPSPYVLPIASASTSEQASHLVGQPITNPKQQTHISCNPRSREASGSAWKVQFSKESDLQGSTASSPAQRISESSRLPLFPTAPCNEDSNQSIPSRCGDQRTQAIKVVPHNPMSASKSAARIFRSIQKERQKYC